MESSESSSSSPSLPREPGSESVFQSLTATATARTRDGGGDSDRHRDFSLFLPFLLNPTESDPDHTDSNDDDNNNSSSEHNSSSSSSSSSDDHPSSTDDTSTGSDPRPSGHHRRSRVILINPLTQGMVVIEGENLRSLLEEGSNPSFPPDKNSQPPASRASIEAMKTVELTTDEEEKGECCAICLDEWSGAVVVKEMPCKHRFHGECVEKWLRIHGSCPVCRFRMPCEDDNAEKKGEDEGEGDGDGHGRRSDRRMRWGGERGVWVSFSFGNRRRRHGDDFDDDFYDSDDDE